MSYLGLAAAAALTLALLAVILGPLLRSDEAPAEFERGRQRDRLLVAYDRVLTNIRDLDEDYSTGKMPPDDYHAEREGWVQRGIQILKALDALETAP